MLPNGCSRSVATTLANQGSGDMRRNDTTPFRFSRCVRRRHDVLPAKGDIATSACVPVWPAGDTRLPPRSLRVRRTMRHWLTTLTNGSPVVDHAQRGPITGRARPPHECSTTRRLCTTPWRPAPVAARTRPHLRLDRVARAEGPPSAAGWNPPSGTWRPMCRRRPHATFEEHAPRHDGQRATLRPQFARRAGRAAPAGPFRRHPRPAPTPRARPDRSGEFLRRRVRVRCEDWPCAHRRSGSRCALAPSRDAPIGPPLCLRWSRGTRPRPAGTKPDGHSALSEQLRVAKRPSRGGCAAWPLLLSCCSVDAELAIQRSRATSGDQVRCADTLHALATSGFAKDDAVPCETCGNQPEGGA